MKFKWTHHVTPSDGGYRMILPKKLVEMLTLRKVEISFDIDRGEINLKPLPKENDDFSD